MSFQDSDTAKAGKMASKWRGRKGTHPPRREAQYRLCIRRMIFGLPCQSASVLMSRSSIAPLDFIPSLAAFNADLTPHRASPAAVVRPPSAIGLAAINEDGHLLKSVSTCRTSQHCTFGVCHAGLARDSGVTWGSVTTCTCDRIVAVPKAIWQNAARPGQVNRADRERQET